LLHPGRRFVADGFDTLGKPHSTLKAGPNHRKLLAFRRFAAGESREVHSAHAYTSEMENEKADRSRDAV